MATRHCYVTDAAREYTEHQRSTGLAESTLAHQEGYIRRFLRDCDDEARARGKRVPLAVSEIDSSAVSRYFKRGRSSAGSMNMHLVALRKFLRWCEANGILAYGDAERILWGRKHQKHERTPKHYVPASQFEAMLAVSGERHPEDRMVMALALFTLGRKSEITGLRLVDVDLGAATLQVYRQKTGRWSEVGICPELAAELESWLDWYATELWDGSREQLMAEHPDWKLVPRIEPVFSRKERGRYDACIGYDLDPTQSPEHLERILKRALDQLGAQTREGRQVRHVGEGMHTIRRSGARAMLDHLSGQLGFDRALLRVQTMLDHEDPKMTLVYIGMDQEREELNDWLRTSSPYGSRPKGGAAKVIPLRRAI